jgi:hypothetical protein
MIEARCDIVIVDELHNINMATTVGEDHSDHMKIPGGAPAGHVHLRRYRCRAHRVVHRHQRQQLAGRCALVNAGPFPFHDEWTQLVAGMESTVRLHRHEPGSLVAAAKYLHQRTGGMIGSLSHLIRAAAIRAILGETEAITQAVMDKVRIDHAAESSTRRTSSSR